MRPNRLVLKAFGPFKNETIHFDTLQNHKLFLISGKTGAGKTTIFDGIMYALFGVASTSDRDETNLRNINALDEEPTEVIYNFYMQDKQYEIHRDLPFIKSGNKTKKATQLTIYEIVDGQKQMIATGLKAAKDAIQSIVKLNAAQFRKIFILPQGEFKSLLVSGSKEKSEILRTLFDTTKIQRLSMQLRDKVATEQKTILAMEAELGVQFGLFQSLISLTDEETYQEKIARIDAALVELNQTIDTSIIQLNTKKKALKAQEIDVQKATVLSGNIEALKQSEDAFNALLNNEQTIQTKNKDLKHLVQFEHYQVTHNDLNHAKQKHSEFEAALVSHSKKYEVIKAQLSVLQEQLHNLNANTDEMNKKKHFVIQNERYLSNKYEKLSQDIEDNTHQLHALNEEISKLQHSKNKSETTEKEIASIEQKRLKMDVEINTLETKITQVQNQVASLTKLLTQLNRIQTTHDDIKSIEKAIVETKSQLKALQSSETIQDVDAIQAIQSTLKVGDKCPICAHTIETLDDDTHKEAHHYQVTLDKQRLALQQQQTTLTIYLKDVEPISKLINMNSDTESIDFENEVEKFNEQITKLNATQIDSSAFRLLQQQINEITHQSKQQIGHANAEFDSLLKARKSMDEQLVVLQEALKLERDIEETLANKQKEMTKVEQLKQVAIQAKSTFIEDTGETDYALFKTKIEQHKKDYLQFESTVSKIEKDIAKCEKEQLVLSENIISLKKQQTEEKAVISKLEDRLAQFNIPASIMDQYAHHDIKKTVALFESEIKAYQERHLTLSNEINRLKQLVDDQPAPDIETLQTSLKQQSEIVESMHANVSTLQEQHKMYVQYFLKLSQHMKDYESIMGEMRSLILLSNALNGNNPQKIDIETYVLMYYLEQTLRLANVRLRQMTSNRYELRRRTEKRGGGKQGLVIDVFDYNANQSRSISSLSGGETFLASLCLALGLSDFVMQNSGGIHLEAVFIDEGFGTLDNETLEVAINALIDLQTSGKLVGMISHVQLLKERIPALLKIETNGFDSHAVFEIK